MVIHIVLTLFIMCSSIIKSESDSPSPFIHYKNPAMWTYGVGTAAGLIALYEKYGINRRTYKGSIKDLEVDILSWTAISAILIGGTTAWLGLAKLEKSIEEYFDHSPEETSNKIDEPLFIIKFTKQ